MLSDVDSVALIENESDTDDEVLTVEDDVLDGETVRDSDCDKLIETVGVAEVDAESVSDVVALVVEVKLAELVLLSD